MQIFNVKPTNGLSRQNEKRFDFNLFHAPGLFRSDYGTGGDLNFVNCTFAYNTSSAYTGGMRNYNASPYVVNSIFWGNHTPTQTEFANAGSASPVVEYSDIEDWTGGGTGNIDVNPVFSDPLSFEYWLQGISPCIDTGTTPAGIELDHDIDGYYRPAGAGYDMGAYEYQP